MRLLLFLSVGIFPLQDPGQSAAPIRERPNILLLLSDDQRADAIAHHGNGRIETPHLDGLARAGFSFRNAYCFGSPHGAVCQSSRAMLHTGKTFFRLGRDLSPFAMLGQRLGKAGYETFGTGKWHNGKPAFARSFQHGRDILFDGMSNHARVPICDLKPDQTFTDRAFDERFSSQIFSTAAIKFLKSRNRKQPFFCYVSYTAPHDPRMPPGEYATMYSPSDMRLPKNFMSQHPFNTGQLTVRDEALAPWPRTEQVIRQQLAEYYGMISHLDHQIGRILTTIEDQGLREKTVVIFASDHGLAIGSHGLLGKQSLYEHSMKAPLILRGPGIQPGSSDALVYLHDLFPTICELASLTIPAETQGISLLPIIEGRTKQVRDTLFTAYGKWIRAVRDDRWKLIVWPQLNKTQLFDLEDDPDELYDLAASTEHVTLVSRLKDRLIEWQCLTEDKQSLSVDQPIPETIDLSGQPRKPDRWQPDWIIRKYFSLDDPKSSAKE